MIGDNNFLEVKTVGKGVVYKAGSFLKQNFTTGVEIRQSDRVSLNKRQEVKRNGWLAS